MYIHTICSLSSIAGVHNNRVSWGLERTEHHPGELLLSEGQRTCLGVPECS